MGGGMKNSQISGSGIDKIAENFRESIYTLKIVLMKAVEQQIWTTEITEKEKVHSVSNECSDRSIGRTGYSGAKKAWKGRVGNRDGEVQDYDEHKDILDEHI